MNISCLNYLTLYLVIFKRQEKKLNYAKHFHKILFDVNLQKTYLKSLSSTAEFHLEDAVIHLHKSERLIHTVK